MSWQMTWRRRRDSVQDDEDHCEMRMAADPPWIRGHPPSVRSAVAGAGAVANAVTRGVEDLVEHTAEGVHDGDDEGGDAGDQKAVLDGRRASFVEPGTTGIDH